MNVTVKVKISLRDYLSKWGFCDGSPMLMEVGYRFQPLAVDILNAHLPAGYSAHEECVQGSHNECRIYIMRGGEVIAWGGEIPKEVQREVDAAERLFRRLQGRLGMKDARQGEV